MMRVDRLVGRRIVRVMRAVIVAPIVAAVTLASCTNATTPNPTPSSSPSLLLPSPNPAASGALASDPVVQVVKAVAPAVVNITSTSVTQDALGGSQQGRDVGTGFVIRSDGVIVTNFHVVEGSLSIKVTLPPPDGRSFDARVIGGDSAHDLAVLKVNGRGLPTVPLGDSSKVLLGEPVIALGYALALPGGPTVTSGIISAVGRTVQAQDPNGGPNGQPVTRTYQDALQTDAAINPGNSGGPLVDLAGNVVGINTAGNTQAENVGFAISIDAAKQTIDAAIARPGAPVAFLGVVTSPVDPGLAAAEGLPVSRGAQVLFVAPGGPAEGAGIKQNDIIVAFGGKQVTGPDDLGQDVFRSKPGDRVPVEVVRPNGDRVTVTVTLGVRPLPTG